MQPLNPNEFDTHECELEEQVYNWWLNPGPDAGVGSRPQNKAHLKAHGSMFHRWGPKKCSNFPKGMKRERHIKSQRHPDCSCTSLLFISPTAGSGS